MSAAVLTGLGTREIWGLALGILVFAAVLGGFAYLSRRIAKGAVLSGRRVKVLDRTMLSREVTLVIVQVDSRVLAIGVGKGGASLLCELSDAEVPRKADGQDEGLWSRLTRGWKTNAPPEQEDVSSFAEIYRQVAGNDPVPGAANAGDAGYLHMQTGEPARFKRPASYQASIENMTRLSEPEALDRRSRFAGTPPARPTPTYTPPPAYVPPPVYQPPPPEPVYVPEPAAAPEPVSEEDRAERIDQLLDLISQRQSRLDDRNGTGDKG